MGGGGDGEEVGVLRDCVEWLAPSVAGSWCAHPAQRFFGPFSFMDFCASLFVGCFGGSGRLE